MINPPRFPLQPCFSETKIHFFVGNLQPGPHDFCNILINLAGFRKTMAKAYKVTSDPFFVNGNLTLPTATAGDFSQVQISLPLDSLNQEGILVHAVYWTSSDVEFAGHVNAYSRIQMQLTSTSKTGMVGANDANLIARREVVITGGAAEFSGPHVIDLVGEEGPYAEEDNLMIIATDDCFLGGVMTSNQGTDRNIQFRMVCSRIRLDSAAYAALVTNELSS